MLSKKTVVQIIIIFVGLFDICNNIAIILEGKLFCCLLFYFVFKILAKLIKKKKEISESWTRRENQIERKLYKLITKLIKFLSFFKFTFKFILIRRFSKRPNSFNLPSKPRSISRILDTGCIG